MKRLTFADEHGDILVVVSGSLFHVFLVFRLLMFLSRANIFFLTTLITAPFFNFADNFQFFIPQ